MTPYHEDAWLTVYQGDCRAVLAELPDESVHCVVTSPPYWGLRDYGTATWDGGDSHCAHRIPATGSTQNKGNNNRGQGFTRRSEQRTVQVPVAAWMEAGLEVEITAPTVPPTWEERKAAGATAGNVGVSETYQNGVHGDGLSHELGDGGLRRNLRSVWTIATQPYPGAHFATFPRRLVEPCIKAGCPENGVVLDPFAGSGTTGMVAQSLSRRAILIDLNADYLVQAMGRNRDIPLGLVG